MTDPAEGCEKPLSYLLGIVSNKIWAIEESTKEHIGLSEVFHATLIPEIIDDNRVSSEFSHRIN
jgi:hypothetical protein